MRRMSDVVKRPGTMASSRRGLTTAGLYALFAAAATSVNLAVQALVLFVTDSVLLALGAGTIAGLPVKYVLDKRYIFEFQTTGARHDGALFVLYTGFSVVTTGVFWGAEWLAHHLTSSNVVTLAGGAVGLAFGYALKYWLDARFVFVARPGGVSPGGRL